MARLRLVDPLGAFAFAGELGRGLPAGHVARTCAIAMGLADELQLPVETRRDVFYASVLVHAGCTAGVGELAAFLLCDELALQRDVCLCDPAHEFEALRVLLRHSGSRAPAPLRVRSLFRLATGGERVMREIEAGCSDVGSRIAARMGLPEGTVSALAQICETWNGKGPHGLKEDEIPLASRIVHTAMTLELFIASGGVEAARGAARRRTGKSLDPALCEAFDALAVRDGTWAGERAGEWEQVLRLEPEPVIEIDADQADALSLACADFADLKLPGAAAHSRRAGDLAERVSARMGLSAVDVALARRAGHVHAIGYVALPALVLLPGRRLSRAEQEQLQLHPVWTRRILAQTVLARPAEIAALHHEALDGSGYPDGQRGEAIPVVARAVAAADAFDEARMQADDGSVAAARAALAGDGARRFGGDVWAALVAEVEGRSAAAQPAQWPAGLTDREVEVLRVAARGATVREIAQRLSISPHTARHHLENVYGKAAVTSRAGATLFAMENGLLS